MSVPTYCPNCGSVLGKKLEGGRERPACMVESCGFFHFGDSSIGCGGVVIKDGKALLIQRGINPGRGTWQIPGGYVEIDESIPAAAEREVFEEAGVIAKVLEAVGFRHSAGIQPDRPNANLYVVFRLEPVEGEPCSDGEETMAAGYFTPSQIEEMDGVQALSKWAIHLVLDAPPGGGLVSHQHAFDERPGWSVFGLSALAP